MTGANGKELEPRISLFWLLFSVFVAWSLSGILLLYIPDPGTFGDMFGAVNALFSGLAFATLIYTIYLQKQELRLQRKELRFTRREIKGQKLQLAAQNDVLRIQNFESSFFQLLKLLADIVADTDIRMQSSPPITGRDCFSRFYYDLQSQHENTLGREPNMSETEAIRQSYAVLYERVQNDLGHFFRTLYNIVKFVHQSDVQNKRFYTNLIRAQLSSHQLVLLFYNCLTVLGEEKFKPLIEHYALIKTVPKELLFRRTHKDLYADSAYGS